MDERPTEIRRIAIIGCGTVGSSWAAFFAGWGFDVVAFDPDPQAGNEFETAFQACTRSLGVDPETPRFCENQEQAVRDADLVVENAPESVELKQRLIAELQKQAPGHAVIASSTSSLRHSDIAAQAAEPGRVVVAHPFNPPHLIPLVELYGPDPDVVSELAGFYEQLGKQPVILRKEMIGHIANRLSSALWREALYLLQEGVASVEDIDRAVTAGPGLRWAIQGPFLTYHLGGGAGGIRSYLDHLGPSQQARWASLGEPVLDERLKRAAIEGVEQEAKGRSVEELAASRDAELMSLIAAKKPPSDKGGS